MFDRVVESDGGLTANWTWTGTAEGALRVRDQIYPAAGRTFLVPGVAWCRLADDGRLVSHEDYYDMHALISQLSQKADRGPLPA